jgi:hypothetical protein
MVHAGTQTHHCFDNRGLALLLPFGIGLEETGGQTEFGFGTRPDAFYRQVIGIASLVQGDDDVA